MRTNLKVFRIRHQMSQEEMSAKIGCTRATYAAVENGARNGKPSFWKSLQDAFRLPDQDMWQMMKND